MDGPSLVVVGAINVDLVVSGARLPRPGETIAGGTFTQHHGGKGGNQAVAAARALAERGRVAMVGCVGDDGFGASAVGALRAEGIDTALVAVAREAATGIALIVVDPEGENQISTAPGANLQLGPSEVTRALDSLRPGMMLASLETPLDAVRAAGDWCRGHGVPLVLNPAPANVAARDLLPLADYLTPNEMELAALGEVPAGVAVIETRGAFGVRIRSNDDIEDVQPFSVNAVDTTGAGDCFNGVLAAGLLEHLSLRAAVDRAVVAAGLSVTKRGAREGMPTRAEIDAAMP